MNPGAPFEPAAPPKMGFEAVEVDPAPKAGVDALPAVPPNWKVLGPVVAEDVFAPKLNMPPVAGAGVEAAPEVSPGVPAEKGLLKELPALLVPPPPPKLKLKLPDPALPVPFVGAAVDAGAVADAAPPKMGVEEVLCPLLKLKMGAGEGAPLRPPENIFLAGDGPSCFMGLPPKALAFVSVGDFGPPKRGAAVVPLGFLPPSKLNIGVAEGGASFLGAMEALAAPKRDFAGVPVEAPPKRLLALPVV